MAYYGQGDFYRGDYYAGDPFFPALAKIGLMVGKKVLPKAIGLIRRVLPGARRGARVVQRAAESPVVRIIGGAAGAGAGFELGGRAMRGRRGPAAAAGPAFGELGRRRRRMNPGNARALVRAGRRMRAFAKLARMAIRFTSPKPAVGRPIFKRKGRR